MENKKENKCCEDCRLSRYHPISCKGCPCHNPKQENLEWEKFRKEFEKQGYKPSELWRGLPELLSDCGYDFHFGENIEKLKSYIKFLLSQSKQRLIEKLERIRKRGNPEFETNQEFGYNQALAEAIKLIENEKD